jgi:hypothetical protein
VVAAGAAEPVGAGAAARFDVGGFGADSERDGDLADGTAGTFGVEQGFGAAPDVVAVAVELQGGDPVDRFAAASFPDAVVPVGAGYWSRMR